MKKLFASFIALCLFAWAFPVAAEDFEGTANKEGAEIQSAEENKANENLENVKVIQKVEGEENETTAETKDKTTGGAAVFSVQEKEENEDAQEAQEESKSAVVTKEVVQEKTQEAAKVNMPVAPKWEDYVPRKYQNPRGDFKRSSAITELSFGILLTDLLFTAPIGIPMICHSTTKLKNISYYEKKQKFFKSMEVAKTIDNPQKRQAYYEKVLKKCKMTEKQKQKLAKKRAKKQG